MIKNSFQLKRMYDKVAELRRLLPLAMDKQSHEDEQRVKQIAINDMINEIDKYLEEIEEYRKLEAGEADLPPLDHVIDAAEIMMKWRIAKGLSSIELCQMAKLDSLQVEKWEQEDYEKAPLGVVIRLAITLKHYEPIS